MSIIYEGTISVKAALQSKYRSISEVWMDEKKKSKDFGYILKMCEVHNIAVKRVSREEIDAVASGKTHGGLIAYVSNRRYVDLDELFACEGSRFFVLLEGIEDSYNVGYSFRSLYAAGCQGVIMPKRDWSKDEGAIVKSSAGAYEKLPIYVCDDYSDLLDRCKKENVQLVCAMREDAIDMYEYDYTQSVILALGGPLRVLSTTLLQHTNQNIYIPYATEFRNALNASSAVSILAYEVFRQRR